jgi:hypothetical protein
MGSLLAQDRKGVLNLSKGTRIAMCPFSLQRSDLLG